MIQEIKWESSEGMLKANGQTFNLKGINWYGFEVRSFLFGVLFFGILEKPVHAPYCHGVLFFKFHRTHMTRDTAVFEARVRP